MRWTTLSRYISTLALLLPLTGANCFDSLNPSTTNKPLSPAAKLAGTWRTAIPVRFKYQTDACGNRQTFGQADWNVTWIITAVAGNDNQVDIEMRRTAGTIQAIAATCTNPGVGYVPLVSPTFLTMNISSSAVNFPTRRDGIQFSGSITTDLMMGTWTHWECLLLCFGEFTDANALKLVRQ